MPAQGAGPRVPLGRGARIRRVLLVVGLAAVAAVLAAYKPSLSPLGLHPRNVEFAAAKAEILVDTRDSALVDRSQEFVGSVQLSTTYALYLQSDAVRSAIGRAVGLRGTAVGASGPFTLLLGRRNFASTPNLPPYPTDKRYRLLVDVDGARPMITLYGQAPTVHAAVAIVDAARSILERHVAEQEAAYPLSAPDRATLRRLGPTIGAPVDPGATPQLIGFVFMFVLITGLIVLQGAERRRRLGPAARPARLGVDDLDDDPADAWPHTSRLLPWGLATFVAMVFLVPFDSAQLPLVHLPLNSNMDRPVLVVLVMLWLAGIAFATGAARPRVKLTAIHVILVLFFIACCASLVFNGDSLMTMGDLTLSLKKIALLLSYMIFFIIVASVVRPSEVPRFATLMIVLGVFVAFATVIEFRFHFNVFYSLWKHVISVTVPVDLDKPDSIGRLTVYGPTGQPLELAALLAMVLPFAMIRLIDSKARRQRIIYLIAVGALLAGGLATSRKTSIVAPIIGILVLMAYRPRVMLKWVLQLSLPLFILIHITSPGALGSVASQLLPGHVNSVLTTKDRTARYDAVRPDVMTHVLIGRGYQSYDPHKYRILDNQYLQVVIGVGMIGLALYGAIFVAMMVAAHPTIRGPNPRRAALALAASSAVAVVIVANALFDVMSFPHVPYLVFFVGGLILALKRPELASTKAPAPRPSLKQDLPELDPIGPPAAREPVLSALVAAGAPLHRLEGECRLQDAHVVQEHQREQPERLRFLGGEGELAGEPDRLAGQVHPGAEATDGAQGQRHLGRGREIGVTAAEQQEQGVVALLGGGRPRLGGPRLGVHRLLAALAGRLAAAGVAEPPRRNGRQPRPRVARRVLGPHTQRLKQRLVQCVLGGIEVFAPPNQGREHPWDEVPPEPAQRGLGRDLIPPLHWHVDHDRVSPPTAPRT